MNLHVSERKLSHQNLIKSFAKISESSRESFRSKIQKLFLTNTILNVDCSALFFAKVYFLKISAIFFFLVKK